MPLTPSERSSRSRTRRLVRENLKLVQVTIPNTPAASLALAEAVTWINEHEKAPVASCAGG